MSEGMLIVTGLRLVIPLIILRWPLVGGIIAMLLDASDVILIELIGLGGFGDRYSQIDKALDTYYLTLEMIVAFRWTSPYARVPAIVLYVYRGIGVIAFETTHIRPLLLVFPNLFENWWLYCVIVAQFFPRLYPKSMKTLAIPLVALLIPKLGQEYLLHYREAEPWDWTKHHILGR